MRKSVMMLFALPAGLGWTYSPPADTAKARLVDAPPPLSVAAAPAAKPEYVVRDLYIAKNSSLSKTIAKLKLSRSEQTALIASLESQLDTARMAPGTHLRALLASKDDVLPARVELELSPTEFLTSEHRGANEWVAFTRQVPIEHRLAAYSGVVATTLWNSAKAAGMDPKLAAKLTDVFAWQIDFNHDVHPGDRWRLTIERDFASGKQIGYGAIVAAEYSHAGEVVGAVRYGEQGEPRYYTPSGDSLRRMFLRSPIHFAHITSGFNNQRYHPILKVRKPHHGIDYGAPSGTPVMAVGDGEVVYAGRKGPSGNMITIRHGSTYETYYKHLSRFAAEVKAGRKVAMGQVIGYVGSTGMATGPHLHFEFHVNGRYTDPQEVKLPAADPVPMHELPQFRLVASREVAELPPWSAGVITSTANTRRVEATE